MIPCFFRRLNVLWNYCYLKKIFKLKYLGETLFIFLIVWLFTLIPLNFDFLNPVIEALNDFDTSDIVFSRLRQEQPADTNIVIVNIGYLNRSRIANELNIVESYSPKVIGMDTFFWKYKNTRRDSLLACAISKYKNIVLASKLGDYNEVSGSYDTLFKSLEIFQRHTYSGYANLPSNNENDLSTIRTFIPRVRYKDSYCDAFATKVVSLYYNQDTKFLEHIANKSEIINYRGNFNKFYFLNAGDLNKSNINLDFLKNKIVLFGFTGTGIDSKVVEDKFYTPLNPKYVGKSLPDMYGVVIHANIISMMTNRNYISVPNFSENLFISFIIIYLNVFILSWVKANPLNRFDILTLVAIIAESIFLLLISLEILLYLDIKISLTLALIGLILSSEAIDIYENLQEKFLAVKRRYKDRESI